MSVTNTSPAFTTVARPVFAQHTAADQVLMFVNRIAGAGRRRAIVRDLAQAVGDRGFHAEVITDLPTLREQAAELHAVERLRAVISLGGDGTFGAVLNATPPGAPLAVLPLGTENLLARYLNHRCSIESVLELLEQGVVVPLDAGRAGERLFAMVLSAGLDAEVVRRVHERRKGNITHLAYAQPILDALRSYRFPTIRASWMVEGAATVTFDVSWAFAINLPRYALQLPLAPAASGMDGALDVCLLRRGSTMSGLWYLWHILRHRHQLLECVTTAKVQHLRLEPTDDTTIAYQIDGDPGGVLPVDIAAVPARMNLLVTPLVAERMGFAASIERD